MNPPMDIKACDLETTGLSRADVLAHFMAGEAPEPAWARVRREKRASRDWPQKSAEVAKELPGCFAHFAPIYG